jgi:DNA helicase HerA-like ATPase
VAHIQSAGSKAQKKSVIGAHNRCWKYLIGDISTHGEATRDLEFMGGDKDRQLKQFWTETRIGNILPRDENADEAERLLENDQAHRQVPDDDHEQSFVRPRVQAHIRSKAKLPRTHGLASLSKASKRWKEKQMERMEDGKLN